MPDGSAATPFVGILGWPLGFTLSPAIHSAAFRALGLGWTYLSWPVPPDRLPAAVNGLRALGAAGANVTIPHKITIASCLDGLSGDAAAIGAVNTVHMVGGRLIGHNTDVEGFAEFVSGDAGYDIEGRSVLLLGAGGAARAVAWSLRRLKAGPIAIAARSPHAADEIAALVDGRAVGWHEAETIAAASDVVVNATPVGGGAEPLLPSVGWRPHQVVVDLLYHPPETPLLAAARAGGAQAWGGLGMLVRQAAASFSLWTGQSAPLEVMSAAALRALRHAPL